MCKTRQMSWIGNSGLRLLDYQKTIFTGLELLDFPAKEFHRSWIAKSGLSSLTEKKNWPYIILSFDLTHPTQHGLFISNKRRISSLLRAQHSLAWIKAPLTQLSDSIPRPSNDTVTSIWSAQVIIGLAWL